jgi:multiple sugar transport system substrate-binding protein
MEELVDYAAKLTVRDEEGKLDQVGFIPDFPRSHTGLYVRMFGGAVYDAGGAGLTANSQAAIDAQNWQSQFYGIHAPEDLEDFVSSFTPYMDSSHPVFAGRRMSCQQCHRAAPIRSKRIPDTGFYEGRIAMMVDGQWQVHLDALSPDEPPVYYGVAPLPPPAAHPERAGTVVVQGPVVFIPAGALDKEAAANLLAWMMSPGILAEAAYAHALLPTSRLAAREPRFGEIPGFGLFVDLLAHPHAGATLTTPISQALNEALGRVEEEVLHRGGDPVPLLDEVQAGLAPGLREASARHDGP